MIKFFRNMLEWVTNPRKKMDRTIMGSIWSQLFVLLLFFFAVFSTSWFISRCFDESFKINKEITSRPWSILAQMVDPGNQHMVAYKNEAAKEEQVLLMQIPRENSKNNKKGVKPDSIIVKYESKADKSKETSIPFRFRLYVFLVSIFGTFIFTGLLISTLTSAFERRVEKIKNGLTNYRFNNHRVIIGFDTMAIGLIKQLLSDTSFKAEILIHTQQSIPEVREKVFSIISNKDRKRIVFMFGSRDQKEEIQRLKLSRADKIYILGEPEGTEYDHDARNIACYKQINSVLKESHSQPKECYVLFENPTTFTAFQFGNLKKEETTHASMHSFNFHESWAQKVFVTGKYEILGTDEPDIDYEPLYHKVRIDENSVKYVHLVVLGMTRMGRALAIEAARLGHYANFEKKKTRITFIDMEAERHEQFFRNCYESFYNAVDVLRENTFTTEKKRRKGKLPFINIELEFITARVESEETRNLLIKWASDQKQLLTIAVCFNYPPFSLSTAMYLPKVVFENEIPVLVRQESSYVIASMLCDDGNSYNIYKNIRPFGMIDYFPDIELLDDWKAKRVSYYYSNLFKPLDAIDFNNEEVIENNWLNEEEKNKWANRYIVQSFSTKYRTIGKDIKVVDSVQILIEKEIDLLARMEHARWNIERLLAGYVPASNDIIAESMNTSELAYQSFIANGCNKDDEEFRSLKDKHKEVIDFLKTEMKHSCLIPYQDLSNYYKYFDRNLIIAMPKISNMYAKNQKISNAKKRIK